MDVVRWWACWKAFGFWDFGVDVVVFGTVVAMCLVSVGGYNIYMGNWLYMR